MLAVLLSIICATISVVLMDLLRVKIWEERWNERGLYFSSSARWRIARPLASVALGASLAFWWGEPIAALYLGSMAWLGLTALETDLLGKRIPREPCWTVLGLGILVGFTTFSPAGAASALVAFLLVAFILLGLALLTRGGLGSGDVRLYLAFTPMAWWIGFTPLLVGLFIASILQIVVRLAALITRQDSKYLPFGPALFLGAYISAIIWRPEVSTSCDEWLGLIPCQLGF